MAERRISLIETMIKTMSPSQIDFNKNPELLKVWEREYDLVCGSLNNAEKALNDALNKAGYGY